MSETTTQRLLLLTAPQRLPDLRLFRRNVGVARAASGNMVRFGIKGLPDVYGLWKGGKYIELELKSKTGRLTPEQAAYRAWCERWGVPHLVLIQRAGETDEETVTRWIQEIRNV